jgi:hypothetical protein
MFSKIRPTHAEIEASVAGDDIVRDVDVVMDRAFTLPQEPAQVWPWFEQLGKNRSGWYLPRWVETLIPKKSRALRSIEPTLQDLTVGKIIDDWGGRDATFEVAILEPPHTVVYTSRRGNVLVTWAITLRPQGTEYTRVHLRLRLAPIKHRLLAEAAGGFVDALTIAGLAAGLRERLT